jgi:enhancing lycopene biosynthesis protein 2
MTKRVGLLLSGCGVFDGSEIHEAVLTMLFLDQAGVDIVCTAPNNDHVHVLNHMSNEEMNEIRNVLIESARIARGDIIDLKDLKAQTIDALIIPGGFGAAKNLSNFAIVGPDAVVHPEVARILEQMVAAEKPIGALGIAPATVTKALGGHRPDITIGTDLGTAEAIETMGGKHHNCNVEDICVDEKNKIVTTPAYMLGPGIQDIAVGIEKLVRKVLALID